MVVFHGIWVVFGGRWLYVVVFRRVSLYFILFRCTLLYLIYFVLFGCIYSIASRIVVFNIFCIIWLYLFNRFAHSARPG